MAYRFNPFTCQFDYYESNVGGTQVGYPVNYCNTTELTIPAAGAPYAPDGTNISDGETVLFTSLTTLLDRGVYRATVVGGNVTTWTRVVYGADPNGYSLQNDVIFVLFGTTYSNYTFTCTSTPLRIWIGVGVPYPQLYSEIWINTSVAEQTGVQYHTHANAQAYIMTQSPSSANRWVIKCSEEIGLGSIYPEASITMQPYVYIDLNSSGFISCPVLTSGGFTGDLYAYQIKNGEIKNLQTDCMYAQNCLISGGDMPNGTVFLSNNCSFYDGDFTTTHGGANPTNDFFYNNHTNSYVFGGQFKSATFQNATIVDQLYQVIPGNPYISFEGASSFYHCSFSAAFQRIVLKSYSGCNFLLNSSLCFGVAFVAGNGNINRLVNSSLLTSSYPGTLNATGYEDDGSTLKIYGTNLQLIYSAGFPKLRTFGFTDPTYNGVFDVIGGHTAPDYVICPSVANSGGLITNAGYVDLNYYHTTGYEADGTSATVYVDDLIGFLIAGSTVIITGCTDTHFNGSWTLTEVGSGYIKFDLAYTLGNTPDTGGVVQDLGSYNAYTLYGGATILSSMPNVSPFTKAGGSTTVVGDYNKDTYGLQSQEQAEQITILSSFSNVIGGQTYATSGDRKGLLLDTSGTWSIASNAQQIQGIGITNNGTGKEMILLRGKYPATSWALTDGTVYFDDTTMNLTTTPSSRKAGYHFTDSQGKKWFVLDMDKSDTTVLGTSPMITYPTNVIKTTYQATSPGLTDDGYGNSTTGLSFEIGMHWYDTVLNKDFICKDNSANTAVWEEVVSSANPSTVSVMYQFLNTQTADDSFTLPDTTGFGGMMIYEYNIATDSSSYRGSVKTFSSGQHFIYPQKTGITTSTEYVFKECYKIVKFISNGTDWLVIEPPPNDGRMQVIDQFYNSLNKEWVSDAGNVGTLTYTGSFKTVRLTTGASTGNTMAYDWGKIYKTNISTNAPSFDMIVALPDKQVPITFRFGWRDTTGNHFAEYIYSPTDAYITFKAQQALSSEVLVSTEALNTTPIVVVAPGTGYSDATGVATTGGSGTGCKVNITTAGGSVTAITIDDFGYGYSSGETITITGGDGNATFKYTLPQRTITRLGMQFVGFTVGAKNRIECFVNGVSVGELNTYVPTTSVEPFIEISTSVDEAQFIEIEMTDIQQYNN